MFTYDKRWFSSKLTRDGERLFTTKRFVRQGVEWQDVREKESGGIGDRKVGVAVLRCDSTESMHSLGIVDPMNNIILVKIKKKYFLVAVSNSDARRKEWDSKLLVLFH